MATRKDKIRNKLIATLVTEKKSPCVFCQRIVDDEITYGKLYALGDIQCHYFCVLLSCCLIQKGKDEEGLFGFMYSDIMAEVERCKKHRCSFCGKHGANLGCSISQCRKQFHLPCGRERNAVSLYYGNYKSFCKDHAPKQKIPDHIMTQAKLRMKLAKSSRNLRAADLKNLKELNAENSVQDDHGTESVCVICYEAVDGFPTVQTFWPPCCARDAWFHRSCLQRMALSAGMHYLKCPLCNDKENFYDAVVGQGYYVPDRDAAWELEQNAFAEIYERPLSCSAAECKCPSGRDHDADNGMWDIKLCMLCGTLGAHAACLAPAARGRLVCDTCAPAAPSDLDSLAGSVEALMRLEQQARSAVNSRHGPVMSSRMSLRRTKQRTNYITPSTSRTARIKTETDSQDSKTNTTTSRLELNLKSPKHSQSEKPTLEPNILQNIENKLLSPTKMLEQGFHDKVRCMGVKAVAGDAARVVQQMRERFRKPRPLSEKRRIVNDILDNLFGDLHKENPKTKEVLKEWNSPRKNSDSQSVVTEELQEKTEPVKQDIEDKQEKADTPVKKTDEDPETVEKEIIEPQKEIEDESSNSTFQLPPEFLAENSDDSLPLFETPKKLKIVEIRKDSSVEISADDEIVNVNAIDIKNNDNDEVENNVFKFSTLDKVPKKDTSDIDLESFKNYYLNEVDRDFKCNFNHKHKHEQNEEKAPKLRTAIDFAIDAIFQKDSEKPKEDLKRKMQPKDVVPKKKRKDKKCVLKYKQNETNIKLVCSDLEKNGDIDLTLESRKEKRKRKKLRKNKKLLRENIQVKIKWKKEQLRLKITKSQTKKNKKIKKVQNPLNLKQYILCPTDLSKNVLMKPDRDVTPKKRKYVKLEKSPDNLVQTSIQSFFKIKLPEKSVKFEPEED